MGPVVVTTAGAVRGRLGPNGDVAIFSGVPYASTTGGARRWQPPATPQAWTGIREATTYGPSAPQNPSTIETAWSGGNLVTSEDCLTVNVWTPSPDRSERPVMVWVHGGGFTGGSGSTPWYDGSSLCRRGDVVLVTFNYRLGALGFLDLSAEGGERLAHAANCGILDQVALLRWVRDNIAAFGGDPGNVTLFGESAGAMSIGTLLAMPSASGLFHRAILQSGAAHNCSNRQRARRVAAQLREAAGLRGKGGVEDLEALDADLIISAQAAVERLYQTSDLPFQPVVDGVDLPRPPLEAIAGGSASDIAVIIGTTAEEMRLYSVWDQTLASADDRGIAERMRTFTGAMTDDVLVVYRQNRPDASAADLWVAIATDWVFRIPAIRLLEAQLTHQSACWSYLFTMRSTAFGGLLGSCHGLDIPFTFDALDRPGVDLFTGAPEGGAELAAAMGGSWVAFARTGDPNHVGIPLWPRYDTDRRLTMELGSQLRVVADPAGRERASWDGIR